MFPALCLWFPSCASLVRVRDRSEIFGNPRNVGYVQIRVIPHRSIWHLLSHGRVGDRDSILVKRLNCMMKVEGNARGRKQRVPRGRGRGKRANFQSTDLVVTVSNEDSSSSRLKPPVTTSQPRKIVLNRKNGKLNELCLSFVRTELKISHSLMVFFHFRIH